MPSRGGMREVGVGMGSGKERMEEAGEREESRGTGQRRGGEEKGRGKKQGKAKRRCEE